MTKEKRPYNQVIMIANGIVKRLAPSCERIEIAGSLRREKDMIGDIEIVAVPRLTYDLLGEPMKKTEVDHLLASWPIELTKNGEKYKQFTFVTRSGCVYQVDLVLQPDPATWGVNLMIRTGSADFSRRMVTPKAKGGLMPDALRVMDARVWQNGAAIETPEEVDIFRLWGMEYIEPSRRT